MRRSRQVAKITKMLKVFQNHLTGSPKKGQQGLDRTVCRQNPICLHRFSKQLNRHNTVMIGKHIRHANHEGGGSLLTGIQKRGSSQLAYRKWHMTWGSFWVPFDGALLSLFGDPVVHLWDIFCILLRFQIEF